VDVEFITQALEMLHGASIPAIRRAHTGQAIHAIRDAGLLPAGDCDALAEHYRFLRRISTGLRLFGARPADTLEPAGPLPGRLAKSLDYPSRRELLEDYRRRTAWVRTLYDRVVHDNLTRHPGARTERMSE
jgi:glutamate-ammonia-ligase adenylyltransferase